MKSSGLLRTIRPALAAHPRVSETLREIDAALGRVKHSVAEHFPAVIRPAPRQLTVAITAACNLRCVGCRYGRDFMVGERLPLELMRDLLDDAKEAGISRVRLFGGEPCLHPDLPEMIRHSCSLGMDTYITTNGTLLEQKFDALYDAGLRWFSMGFYGVGEEYASYTQRPGQFERMRAGVESVRRRYGAQVSMQLNFVLLKPTCNPKALAEAWDFARTYDMHFHLDLHGYSIPFFSDGPNNEIPFQPEDRPMLDQVAAEIERLKVAHPDRVPHSVTFIRSVPDWLLKGADMRVPCDAYQLIWVGANGVVQLCDVHFELGNLHQTRLRDLLFTAEHRRACRDAFALRCPNCTCKVETRTRKHAASYRHYGS